MRICSVALTALSWLSVVTALQASEAGVVDWHRKFIGVPRTDTLDSAPAFHRVQNKNDTRSVILTVTENTNVLAALDPVNGSVAWRYMFEPTDIVLSYKKHGSVVAALSGVGGAQLRLFDSIDGDLILEKQLHNSRAGQLFSPQQLGVSISFLEGGDILALTNGHTLYRVHGTTGDIIWAWTSPDEASLVIYDNIVVSGSTVYAIGLAKSIASYTLHVTAISSETGELLQSVDLPSSIANGPADFFPITSPSEGNFHLVWLEKGVVKHVVLTPKMATKPTSISGSNYEEIINLGLDDKGYFVARQRDGTAVAYKLQAGTLKKTWDFASSKTSRENTESLYTGGVDKDGNPYIGRLYWSHSYQAASLHIYSPHLLETGMVTGFTFPFETSQHGIMKHFALDVVNPEGYQVLGRIVLTTSTGAVQLWYDDKVQWTREEALSGTIQAKFVELPEQKVISSHIGEEAESFASRLVRQVSDVQDFPQYLLAFIKRFATGSYASTTSSIPATNSSEALSRDAFGFKKIIVTANRYGKLFGIDSSNGNIVWSRVLGLGSAAQVGGYTLPLKLFVTRDVTDGEIPQVVLVTRRHSNEGAIDTVLFHFDPLTGEDALGESATGDMLQGVHVFNERPLEAFMYEGATKMVVLVNSARQIHLYPETPENIETFKSIASTLHFPMQTSDHELEGFQILPTPDTFDRFETFPSWTFSVPQSEVVNSVVRTPKGPIASLGKVLGNRTTLYKYLNPHLFAVTTVPKSPAGSCSVYLVDGVKGSVVYHVAVPSKGPCSIKAVLTENWLVYSYYDNEHVGVGQSKGHQVVSVEIYEGRVVDEKTRSSEISSFDQKVLEVQTLEQAYVTLRGITALATTSTKFGMSTKDVIVATRNNHIQSIPRRLLDPRRTKDKPTAQEAEEMLIQYDPILPADPRLIISHNYEVANIRKIITSPALLESTSLVFAYGLDFFGTRVAPSNTFDVLSENFNKVQLVFTVAGLLAAIMVTGPMVVRKKLRERWFQ